MAAEPARSHTARLIGLVRLDDALPYQAARTWPDKPVGPPRVHYVRYRQAMRWDGRIICVIVELRHLGDPPSGDGLWEAQRCQCLCHWCGRLVAVTEDERIEHVYCSAARWPQRKRRRWGR